VPTNPQEIIYLQITDPNVIHYSFDNSKLQKMLELQRAVLSHSALQFSLRFATRAKISS
jgi:hypothetical protein